MNTSELKQYLEKELPDFTFTTGEEAGQPKKNWNSIQIIRDGNELTLDVSKVTTKAGAKKLKEFIELKWKGVK